MRETRPWYALSGALVLGGLVLRAGWLSWPREIFFDEWHFVENARNYLAHRADWNDHPPLGKLLIAASIALFGDGPLGWRAPSLLAGVLLVVLAGLVATRLFRSRQAGLVAMALVCADGFFISYSRTAVLDGWLAVAVAAALLLTTLPPSWRVAVLAGLTVGFAISIKFSGVGTAAPLVVGLALADAPWSRRAGWALAAVTVALGVYVSQYALGLWLSGHPAGLGEVVSETRRLIDHHAALTEMKNPYVSSWYTWLLPARSIVMTRVETVDEARVVTMLGNPAIGWAASAAFLGALGTLGWRGARGFTLTERGRAGLVLVAAALGFLAPWIFSRRDSYLYHWLPSYTALVILLSGLVVELRARRPLVAFGYLCLVAVTAAFYAPVWTGIPLDRGAVNARLFLPGWR